MRGTLRFVFVVVVMVFAKVCFSQSIALLAAKPIAKQLMQAVANKQPFYSANLFAINPDNNLRAKVSRYVDSFALLSLRSDELANLLQLRPEYLRLTLPGYTGQQVEVLLQQHTLTTPDCTIETSTGEQVSSQDLTDIHYWGMVLNQPNSMVAISLSTNGVMGLLASGYGNVNLGKLLNSNTYVLYNDANLSKQNDFTCENQFTYAKSDDNKPASMASQQPATNCLRIYWEINTDIYTKHGSLSNTISFVMGIFNQHQLFYANSNISVALSSLFIWNSNSPYSGGNSPGDWIVSFENNRGAFNGDIGTLIKISTKTGGIAGYIDGLCATDWNKKKCYTGILDFYYDLPVYSWTVSVIAHEQAHIMGSKHTHDCVWNGNNTAIDGCGPAAGYPGNGCLPGPIPAMGTIMSYCYIPPNPGVDLSLGFGQQPDSLVIYKINNAPCLAALPCLKANDFAISDNNPIFIYPNPNFGTFTLELAKVTYSKIEIRVYNYLGQLIYGFDEDIRTSNGIYSKQINLINYPAGIYYLQIIDPNNSRITKKVMVQ